MTALERNVKQAQRRLWVNTWFATVGWCLVYGAAAWCLIVLVDKLLGLEWPLGTLALAAAAAALLASVIGSLGKRHDLLAAAAELDRSAGLKERTGSGLYCSDLHDPFARAVTADAERTSAGLRVQSFIRFVWPSSLSFAAAACAVALLVTWLPIKPLRADAKVAEQAAAQPEFVRKEVRQVRNRLAQLQEQARKSGALKNVANQLKTIDELPLEKIKTPVIARREGIKKIDKLTDTIRDVRNDKQQQMNEMKRMFRGLKTTPQPQTPTDRLSKALSKGDFRSAAEALKDMREKLAKLAQKDNPEKRQEMQKQIAKLSKQLEQLAQQQERKEQLKKELEEAGVDSETARRALEQLTKADLQKIKEQMKKQGANDRQMNEMAKKCQTSKQAGSQGSDLAGAMQKAAEAMSGESAMADAAQSLQEVGDMLNSMEQLDQQLGELNSMMSDAQQAQDEMSAQQNNTCQSCGGQGCKACGGSGQKAGSGMGRNLGRGRGGMAPEGQTDVKFVKERTPVNTTAGGIIAKMYIDGKQVRGDVASQAVEVFSAAERNATDALNENKIPNQYRSTVKHYFSQLGRDLQESPPAEEEGAEPEAEEDEPPADGGE